MTSLDMVKEPRKHERVVMPGSWVKAVRQLCKINSQMALAVLIGRDKSTVTRWEGTDGEIDYVSWVGVLTILGLPSTWEPGQPLPKGWKIPEPPKAR